MMLLALLVLQAAVPTPVQPDGEDIVVIAQKLRLIQIETKFRTQGQKLELRRCRVIRSSGDAELDAIPCGVTQECAQVDAATPDTVDQCLQERAPVKLRALVAARESARGVAP